MVPRFRFSSRPFFVVVDAVEHLLLCCWIAPEVFANVDTGIVKGVAAERMD